MLHTLGYRSTYELMHECMTVLKNISWEYASVSTTINYARGPTGSTTVLLYRYSLSVVLSRVVPYGGQLAVQPTYVETTLQYASTALKC